VALSVATTRFHAGQHGLGSRCAHRGDALQQFGFRQHAKANGCDLPGVGLGQENRRYLSDLQGVGDAVVGSGICKARHGAAIHADGHHLDAVARLESRQRGGEGVAVRAVTAEEKEQDVVLAQ